MILSTAETALIALDPYMGRLITTNGPIALAPRRDYFEALSSSIISQQISVKAAAKIFGRFREHTELEPERVRAIDDDTQKAIGLSGQKRRYLHSLAEHFVENPNVFNHLDNLSDEAVIAELTSIKGIGVWTAQMFLIFTLHRPDIFAPDDRGLQLAIQATYGLASIPSRNELQALAEQWQPYRSTACLHLWRSLENTPTQD